MLARPCLTCGQLTRGSSRCATCRQTTAGRGYGSAWQQRSRALIARMPWCLWCGATRDLTVDHIVPLSQGGSNESDNLRVLCRKCNSRRVSTE